MKTKTEREKAGKFCDANGNKPEIENGMPCTLYRNGKRAGTLMPSLSEARPGIFAAEHNRKEKARAFRARVIVSGSVADFAARWENENGKAYPLTAIQSPARNICPDISPADNFHAANLRGIESAEARQNTIDDIWKK